MGFYDDRTTLIEDGRYRIGWEITEHDVYTHGSSSYSVPALFETASGQCLFRLSSFDWDCFHAQSIAPGYLQIYVGSLHGKAEFFLGLDLERRRWCLTNGEGQYLYKYVMPVEAMDWHEDWEEIRPAMEAYAAHWVPNPPVLDEVSPATPPPPAASASTIAAPPPALQSTAKPPRKWLSWSTLAYAIGIALAVWLGSGRLLSYL